MFIVKQVVAIEKMNLEEKFTVYQGSVHVSGDLTVLAVPPFSNRTSGRAIKKLA
jgi:hypothetical protein